MQKPDSCFGCKLYNISDGFSLPEGLGSNQIVIIGEALGWEERIDGLPFRPRAAAGSKLEEIFRLTQNDILKPVTREQFSLYNVIQCHPPGNELKGSPYEMEAIRHCENAHLGKWLNQVKPKVIFALGNIPLRSLTGVSGNADEKQSIYHLRGFVFNTRYGLVVPSFHPSYLRRGNNHLTPIVVEDLKKCLGIVNGEFKSFSSHSNFRKPAYITNANLDLARNFYYKAKDNQKLPITYDIETPDSAITDEDERDEINEGNNEIIQIQFSLSKGEGIAFPFSGDYIPIIRDIFSLPNVKANHNTYNFDNPRLYAEGIEIKGIIHDTMWMFKHWHSRLPRGLQSVASLLGFPFPWKHLYGSNLGFYGCADVDAVQWIIRTLPGLMKTRGIWDGYINHVVRLYSPTLLRARDIGIPVSEEKRIEVEEKLKKKRLEIDSELQTKIPDEIRDISPKRKVLSETEFETKQNKKGETIRQGKLIGYDYGYVRTPKQVIEARATYDRLAFGLIKQDKRVISFEQYIYSKYNLVYGVFSSSNGISGKDIGKSDDRVERFCVLKPFKASSKQLIRYLRYKQKQLRTEVQQEVERLGGGEKLSNLNKRELKEKLKLAEEYEVPLTLKTKKETTGKKELEEIFFKTGDEVIELVLELRSIDYNLNTQLPNWKPSLKDNSVHTTWGFTAGSGQLDSRAPNILNLSKHTEWGQEFRGIVVAPKGRCFVEADKKSFHVATMGYVANDKDYIRFSQIDPHSIFTSFIMPQSWGEHINMSWNDNDIRGRCKEIKGLCKRAKESDPLHGIDIRQALAKPTVLGNQLGLGPIKLQRQNRRYIHTIAEAKRLQYVLSELFPKVTKFKDFIREKAFRQKYLLNEFGFIQYFHDVFSFTFNKKTNAWVRHPGEDSEGCIAFPVQSIAFGMIQEEIMEMERLGICEEHRFINTIHDSVIFMPEESKVDRCIEEISSIMNKPCKKLVNEATGSEGLKVGVEFSVGKNWKSWDKDKNVEGMREIS